MAGHPPDLALQLNDRNRCWFVPAGLEIWFSQGRTILSQPQVSPLSTPLLVSIHPDHIIGAKVFNRMSLQKFGQSILCIAVRYLVLCVNF